MCLGTLFIATFVLYRGLSPKRNEGLGYEIVGSDETIDVETAPKPTSREAVGDAKFARFLKWLRDGGAEFGDLELEVYGGAEFRGISARRNVSKGQQILKVPEKHLITMELAKRSQIGRKLAASGATLLGQQTYISSFLLQERSDPHSFWRPYIDTLPQNFDNVPIFWGDEMLDELKGSFSIGKIDERLDILDREYDSITQHMPEFKRFSRKDFYWARTAVVTRIFGFAIGSVSTSGLVPMADMLNHKTEAETTWTYSNIQDGFIIVAKEDLMRGNEVFDSYGPKCNSRYFVNYGFTMDANELNNEAVMTFAVPTNRMESKSFQVPTSHTNAKVRDLRVFLRMEHTKAGGGAMNEQAVLKSLSDAALEALGKFATTIEEDERILASNKHEPFSPMRNAIVMRLGEKRVLRHYVDLERIASPLLRLSTIRDLNTAVERLKEKATDDDIIDYIDDIVFHEVEKREEEAGTKHGDGDRSSERMQNLRLK